MILVTGGTGFVGSRIVDALRAGGRDVRMLVRRPASAPAGVEHVTGDVSDATSLRTAVEGCTHIVHLVAIIKGRPRDFQRVMADGTRALVAAAREAGVERFVLMSALGAAEPTDATVPYFRAKWAMEQEIGNSGLEHTIFRPSFVFGRGGALPTFVKQVRYSPVVSVIGDGRQRSQPIWVEDVAAYVNRAIDEPHAANRTFELGGPDIVNWDELYLLIAEVLGKRRRLVHVPFGLARAAALATERLPGAPLSADQVAMLQGATTSSRTRQPWRPSACRCSRSKTRSAARCRRRSRSRTWFGGPRFEPGSLFEPGSRLSVVRCEGQGREPGSANPAEPGSEGRVSNQVRSLNLVRDFPSARRRSRSRTRFGKPRRTWFGRPTAERAPDGGPSCGYQLGFRRGASGRKGGA